MTTINELVQSTITEKQVASLKPILNRLYLTDGRTLLTALDSILNSGDNIGSLLKQDQELLTRALRKISKDFSNGDISRAEKDILESYEVAQECLFPEYYQSQEAVSKIGTNTVTCKNGAGVEKQVELNYFKARNGDRFTTLIAPPFKGFNDEIHVLLSGYVSTI